MSQERLWAPWRLEYIRGPKPDECIFCVGADAGDDESRYIVHRGERCFAVLNRFPYNNGHLMIAPYEHVPSIEELDDSTLLDLVRLTQRGLAALREVYRPEGFNLGINQGKVAGAGFEDHVHQHLVPRWGADTNFLPVVDGARVLPQALAESYSELSRAFA